MRSAFTIGHMAGTPRHGIVDTAGSLRVSTRNRHRSAFFGGPSQRGAPGGVLLARITASAFCVALLPLSARAETPFADYCEGNICFQGKVQMGCMTSEARSLMRTIAQRFGKIEIASACDGRHARRSAHYVGKAFDFRPFQATRAEVVAFLKGSPDVGGVGTYSNGLIHADVGDRKMAWHGRGGRAWPIGVDGSFERPIQVASAEPSAASGGLAAAFLRAFEPIKPPAGPTASFETVPSASDAMPGVAANLAKTPAERVPLPPSRPAFLAATASSSVPAATVVAGPTDFAAILRGPLAPSMPDLLEEHAVETAVAAEESQLSVSFYKDDPAPVRARMIAFADLR